MEAPEEDFDSGFFEGYADLKRRVALDHLEWDLSAYSGVESDFWDLEEEELLADPLTDGVPTAVVAGADLPAIGSTVIPTWPTEVVGDVPPEPTKGVDDTEVVTIDG